MTTTNIKPAIAKSRGGESTIEIFAWGDGNNRVYRVLSDNRDAAGFSTSRVHHADFVSVASARVFANNLWATLP